MRQSLCFPRGWDTKKSESHGGSRGNSRSSGRRGVFYRGIDGKTEYNSRNFRFICVSECCRDKKGKCLYQTDVFRCCGLETQSRDVSLFCSDEWQEKHFDAHKKCRSNKLCIIKVYSDRFPYEPLGEVSVMQLEEALISLPSDTQLKDLLKEKSKFTGKI